MSATVSTIAEVIAITGLVGYAIYRQTHLAEVTRKGRFKMAIVYAIIGVAVGGFVPPSSTGAFALLAASIILSLAVGVGRGALTRVWREPDGRIFRQGTPLTVSMFVGMIVVKIGMGVLAYFAHITDSSGFAEIMVMMAIMVAVQAEMIQRRANQLVRRVSRPTVAAAHA